MNYTLITSLLVSVSIESLLYTATAAPVAGQVKIDGSSTLFPLSEAVAEEFGANFKSVRVTVGTSGTGGGFKKFCAAEIDINNASRPIKTSELSDCQKKSIEFQEIPVAYDGLTIVVNPKNTFACKITKAELKKIWEPSSTVKLWSDVNPAWPKEKIALFGPGPDSGTFDYFTEEVVGKSKSSRSDYTASEDDNVLLKGVAASPFGLAYFGHSYFVANKSKLKALAVDGGKGAITPTDEAISSGSYPLSRKLYLYVNLASATKPAIEAFVDFYLQNAPALAKETGFQPLPAKLYQTDLERFKNRSRSSVTPAKALK